MNFLGLIGLERVVQYAQASTDWTAVEQNLKLQEIQTRAAGIAGTKAQNLKFSSVPVLTSPENPTEIIARYLRVKNWSRLMGALAIALAGVGAAYVLWVKPLFSSDHSTASAHKP